jgi:hypothetical protein
LKAKRFPAAGGQESEDILSGESGFDDFTLERSEFTVAEGAFE